MIVEYGTSVANLAVTQTCGLGDLVALMSLARASVPFEKLATSPEAASFAVVETRSMFSTTHCIEPSRLAGSSINA